jgi:hypothetical protein
VSGVEMSVRFSNLVTRFPCVGRQVEILTDQRVALVISKRLGLHQKLLVGNEFA